MSNVRRQKMRGTVVIINRQTGLFAVRLEDGDFSVLELLDGSELEPNDVLAGELDALGGEDINNVTHSRTMSVFGQTGRCSLEAARRLVYGA
jgi:hypothetical protein